VLCVHNCSSQFSVFYQVDDVNRVLLVFGVTENSLSIYKILNCSVSLALLDLTRDFPSLRLKELQHPVISMLYLH